MPGGWRRTLADTVTGQTGLRAHHVPRGWRDHPRTRFFFDREYERMSYAVDWLDAWRRAPGARVTTCNVSDAVALWREMRRLPGYDLVVVLHSAAGDHLGRVRSVAGALKGRRGRLLVLFGNEYVKMPEKIAFARDVEADLVGTQLPLESGRWLYAECARSRVVAAPPALNPALYQPSDGERAVDLGFRGDRYDHMYALGDVDRDRMLEHLREHGPRLGLEVDIAFERVGREAWKSLLASWKGVPSTESGTNYLERDDHTRRAVVAYLDAHPKATFEEVFDRFFRDYPNPVSGKAISSRHWEPIGTKTVQVLLEGRYNDLLVPGRHYLPLRRDFSNLAEVAEGLRDKECRRRIADEAHEYALSGHTYDHRVAALLAEAAA